MRGKDLWRKIKSLLAEEIGIDQNMLSKYETDKVQPTIGRLEWMCTALNVSATELLGF